MTMTCESNNEIVVKLYYNIEENRKNVSFFTPLLSLSNTINNKVTLLNIQIKL